MKKKKKYILKHTVVAEEEVETEGQTELWSGISCIVFVPKLV